MRADLINLTVLNDDDLVRITYGGQPVSDNEGCAALQQLLQRILDHAFRITVYVSRRLIEDKNFGIRYQCTCETQ